MKKVVNVVIGPTASGKTSAAIEKARAINGVIINADSMQIYDALPILTARPTDEEQAAAPHRLFAALPPTEKCTAERWRDMAIIEIERAFENGQTPILCGGTGFYIKALMEGLAPIPDIPEDIRAKTVALQEELGNPAFHAALAEIDPVMASRLNPQDTQRLIRAYEVMRATKKSLSYWQQLPHEGLPPADWEFEIDVIMRPREELHERINQRFDIMMEMGALEEIKALSARVDAGDIPLDAGIIVAHGFRPFRAYLKNEISFDEAAERTKAETRQYAKRQTTWIRHQLADYIK